MKKCIKITGCALLIISFHKSFAMLPRAVNQARQRLATQQLATQRALLQTQTRSMTQPVKTAPFAKTAPTTNATPAATAPTGFFTRIQNMKNSIQNSVWNNWNALRNMFTSKAPIFSNAQSVITQKPLVVDITPTAQTISIESIQKPAASIQAKNTLKNDFNRLVDNIENKLNAIEPTHKKPDELVSPELKGAVKEILRKSFIKCPDATEEIRHLLRMKSLSTYERYVENKKRSILKKMGFTTEEINTLKKQIDSNVAQYIKLYRQTQDAKERDPNISDFQIETAEILLKMVGIEPSNIPIRSTLNNPKLSGDAFGKFTCDGAITLDVLKFEGTPSDSDVANNLSAYMRQILSLKPDPSQEDKSIFIIAHEIGHLIKGHVPEEVLTTLFFMKKHSIAKKDDIPEKIKALFKQLKTIHELQADTWFATQFQNIAEIARDAMVRDVRINYAQPDIYLAPSNKLYVLTKIIQLHEKAATKNNNTPDTAKE